MENFVLYDEIGTGDKRMVYKGRRKGSVSYVAIHCVEKEYRNKIQNHVRISYELDHVNVVQFYEWYETTNHLWLVVELCAGGSLRSILELDSYLPEKEIRIFAKDVVAGLAYLHSQDIIYGDLCASNILLDSSGTLKFSNFCCSKFSDASDGDNDDDDDDVTPHESYFKSPEELNGGEQRKESDFWALGCVLYEMFTGTEPFRGSSPEVVNHKIQHDNIPYPMQGQEGTFVKASEDLYMLIQGLLQKDPSQRIDLLELCMHPFWQGELASLADTFDTRDSLASYTSTSMATPALEEDTIMIDTGRQTSTSEADVIDLEDSIYATDKQLQSQSLNLLDKEEREERQALNSSTRSLITTKTSKKQAWGGTYKLERGSAVQNLAEVVEDQQQPRKNSEKDSSFLSVKSQKSSVASEKSSVASEKSSITSEKQSRQHSAKPPGSERSSVVKTSASTTTRSSAGRQSQISDSLQDSTEPSHRDQADIIPYLGGPDVNVLDHLYHPSDLTVSPIAENRLFDKFPTLKWDSNHINTAVYTVEQLGNTSLEDIRSHLKDITGAFSTPMNSTNEKVRLRQKMNIVAYLVASVRVEEVANCFLKDEIVKCFLNDLKVVSNQDIKMRIARLLSVVASNATSIDPHFKMTDVFAVVGNQLKQNFRNTRLRHALLPVIGEFLFYAATQEENEARSIQSWEPPGAVFTIITRCLHLLDGEEVTRLMAAKVIENITSTTGRYCKKLVNNDVGLGLWNLYTHSSMDNVKETAASALCRLCMHSTVVVQHVSDRAGFDQFVSGATLGSLKTQQSFVTMLVSLLSSPNHSKRILGDRQLLTKLVRNLEGHSLILKGKIYLLLAEMCMRSHPTLLTCCQQKLMVYVERDSKRAMNSSGRDHSGASGGLTEYLHQCLAIVVGNVLKIVPRIQEDIVHILDTISGRHHPNTAQVKQLKTLLPLFDVFMHLITSSVFRKRMGNNFIASIGIFMKRIQKIRTGEINLSNPSVRNLGESLTNTMFSMIEAIAQHPQMLLQGHQVFVNEVLPELAFDDSDGNIKILCLKLFTEISTFYLESEENEGLGVSADQRSLSKINLLKVINKGFIPRFKNLLRDQIPFPSYSLKLMRACVEKSHDMARTLLHDDEVLSMLFSILKDNRTEIYDSVLQSTVGIFSNLVLSKDFKLSLLCEQDFLGDVSSLIETSYSYLSNHSYEMSHLLLQLLDILHHILKKVEEPVKRVLSSKGARKPGSPSANDTERILQETKHLSKLSGILMSLLIAGDADIQEWSCRCLYLSVELYGGSQDECNLTIDNIESLASAVKTSEGVSKKRQKLLMRILKRFLQTNEFCQQYALESPTLKDLFQGLVSATKDGADQDSKSIRQMAADLLEKWSKY